MFSYQKKSPKKTRVLVFMSSISLSSIIKKSAYRSQWVGVRWPLLLSLIAIWLVSLWLKREYGQDDSTLWLVMYQFMRLVEVTIIGLFALSVLSTLVLWAFFLYSIKNKTTTLSVKLGDGQKAQAGWVSLSIFVQGNILRPLLGSVHAKLLFAEKKMTDSVVLDLPIPKPKHWWRLGIKGTGQTLLHDRGIYDVEHVLVFFTDMFGLVSLPCSVPYRQQLITLPKQLEPNSVKANPHSTEEQMQRIDIPRRVEGEHVNYKEFEAGDNINRIVWKIYAKSGQLVVRVPETKDPYASHLYFYVSFFHGLPSNGGPLETELLNIYKDRVRNLFEALQRNGYDVRIPPDQEVPKLSGIGERHNELLQITAAAWQNAISPIAFVKPDKAAFVCLPSLVPASEVEALIKVLPATIPLLVMKLSTGIPSPFKISLKDIFFKPESEPMDSLRQPWLLSTLRRDLIKNEKAIEAILRQRSTSWLTDTLELER
jgi:hypothetical protein